MARTSRPPKISMNTTSTETVTAAPSALSTPPSALRMGVAAPSSSSGSFCSASVTRAFRWSRPSRR
jgi:hypothetical protein